MYTHTYTQHTLREKGGGGEGEGERDTRTHTQKAVWLILPLRSLGLLVKYDVSISTLLDIL